jgi:hypothetical protein
MPASRSPTTLGLLIVAVLVSCTPSFAGESDEAGTQTTTTASHSDSPIRRSLRLPPFDATLQSQLPQGRVVHHCCNTKGAIIGGAIGATIGWWFATRVCDAGSCASTSVKYALVLGGIGGLVGAYADWHNTVPIAPPDRRFRVSAVVTPRTRQALATLAF